MQYYSFSTRIQTNSGPKRSVLVHGKTTLVTKWPSIISQMLVVLALSALDNTGANAAWVIVAIWTLRQTGQAVEGLLLSMLLIFINPAVFTLI